MKLFRSNITQIDNLPKILAFCSGLIVGSFYASFMHSLLARQWIFSEGEYDVVYETTSIKQSEPYNETAAFLVRDSTALSDTLAKQISVLCFVHRNNVQKDHVRFISNTWGSRCTKMMFFDNEYTNVRGVVSLKRNDTHKPTAEDLYLHLFQNYSMKFDWFLNTDGDTYVVMENLRYLLYPYDPSQAIAIGYCKNGAYTEKNTTTENKFQYYSGAAGYVLSREAVKRLELGFRIGRECVKFKKIRNNDDQRIGICLDEMNVHSGQSEDQHGKKRFIDISLNDYLLPKEKTEFPYPWYSDYKVDHRLDKISNYSITFHGVNSPDMHLYDYLIYQLRPYGLDFETLQLPMKVSFENVSVSGA